MIKWVQYRPLQIGVVFILLVLTLLVADRLCYAQALAVDIDIQHGIGTLHVDSQTISLGSIGLPRILAFAPHDPVVHEYQLDGTDSTNTGYLDPVYLHQIASLPYYHFQAWMRDLDGTSCWRDLQISTTSQLRDEIGWPANGSQVTLPSLASLHIHVKLQRPETPMSLSLTAQSGTSISITFDRNNRQIAITSQSSNESLSKSPAKIFFPLDPTPFAAMVADLLVKTLLWSLLLVVVVLAGDTTFALIGEMLPYFARLMGQKRMPVQTEMNELGNRTHVHHWDIFNALHPLVFVALAGSFLFVSWIAFVQYHALPHIYDADTYIFGAKMYAIGRLSVPVPPAVEHFPGSFMVQFHGRWFPQYPPGTSLTLVPGIWLGLPWLVEPLLGTCALLGIGLIAARLYGRRVATLAVLLGILSPFYSYLAASYLSHAIALFYLVWGMWALLRFAQGERSWNMLLSAVCFGMAGLTRDLVAVLFIALIVPAVVLMTKRNHYQNWSRWLMPGVTFAATLGLFIVMTLLFNQALTGSPWVTPRSHFFAGDRWGFGQGVGFYGQHTVAAGFVNLDELLTSLSIDLFGWPFYLTLAFIPIPFLTARARIADWLMLAILIITVGSYGGYFYHGIYLGPRYLLEELPFLLILTTRGIFALVACGLAMRQIVLKWVSSRINIVESSAQYTISITTILLVVGLVLCNLLYFMPRQIAIYDDYTGLPSNSHVDISAILSHPSIHHAIVVVDDFGIYEALLFSLNDPLFLGDVIYAQASTASDDIELCTAFPGRQLYRLDIASDGSVHYTVPSFSCRILTHRAG